MAALARKMAQCADGALAQSEVQPAPPPVACILSLPVVRKRLRRSLSMDANCYIILCCVLPIGLAMLDRMPCCT